ncbi:MAG TPA: DEAD/DEAH box helicase [Caldithrix abyssi]|uniref:3'-5' exonuclease DinG n=1 Tax=Caldithrix abyssi TaxID=187145 RepID=A0A7V4U2K2_CALAY|nr:DEAD/DEAH box helicase [Caldithrix abyssi]
MDTIIDLRKQLLHHLGLATFVVVDLETTGLDPEKDQIIEIGAIKFVDGEEAEVFEELINPGRPIPDFITKLTGISDADVKDKPFIDEVFPRLDRFIGGAAFVGQQVNFDASFLEYHYRKMHNDFERWEDKMQRFKYVSNLRLDTLFLARIFLPFNPSFKLGSLAKQFGYDLENAHQAVEDARATGHVFLELIDRSLTVNNQVLINIINLLYPNSVRAKSFFVPVLNFKKTHNIKVTGKSLLDDVKHAQQYYNEIGSVDAAQYRTTEEPDLRPVGEEEILAYFEPQGKLAGLIENYELRGQQQEMAEAVAQAFNESKFIIAEAGTGTGKSMAYLIPAVEWAARNRTGNQRVIVSTNTKNLQEQLFFKDIPVVFSASGGKFKAVLLKGRGNYLCLEKWHSVMTDMNQRLSQDERTRVLPLVLWVEETRTGDIAENAGFQVERNIGLWSKFIAESSYCPGRSCKYYKECFLMKARESARLADVVVVNHSLLFSDLAADHSILDDYRNLIIDEAHNVEGTAADYLGVRVSFWNFRNIYHKLYEEEPKRSGTLQQLEFRLSKGRADEPTTKGILSQSRKIKDLSLQLKEHTLIFYNEFSRLIRQRYLSANKTNGDDNRVRYFKNFKYFKDLSLQIETLQKTLGRLRAELGRFIDDLSDLDDELFEFQDQLTRELIAIRSDLNELIDAFAFCLQAEQDKFVFWLEIPRNEKSNDIIMHGVPLNIAELLKTRLFDHLDTAVFTSATLAVNNTFDYFASRIGLNLVENKQRMEKLLGSPFNFEEQLMLAIADYLPDPRNAQFAEKLAEDIQRIHDAHRSGMLVLFTSYGLLNRVYDLIKPYFDAERVLLLAQGKSGSRTNMINQFKEYRESVLLGTDSFWEGIDVPGEALELLYIPKLPFDVPSDPVIAARMEEIKKRGGNPFFEYSVPEAVIRFRQGFGRLIRSKNDFGAVIVGDNRLSRMQYGKQFLNSLPVKSSVFTTSQDLMRALGEWFSK